MSLGLLCSVVQEPYPHGMVEEKENEDQVPWVGRSQRDTDAVSLVEMGLC